MPPESTSGRNCTQSMDTFYRSLPERLNNDPSLPWFEMMPPSTAGLLRHYRLAVGGQETGSIAERLTQSAKLLLKEEGLRETLERFACLPARIPELLVIELRRLSGEEKIELLRSLGKGWGSPISNLHLIDLVLRVGDGGEDFLAVARLALDRLFVDEKSDARFSLFHQTLRLVSIGLGRLSDPKQLDVATKLLLVWSHAARLHNICEQIGDGAAFSWASEWSKWENAFADSAYLNDALHPRRLSRPIFLAQGLSAIFADQDKKLVDALNTAELLTTVAFTKSGEHQMPVSQFLFDSTLLLNQTESFLGGDRSDSIHPLLGDAAYSLPSPVDLRRWIAETIERIATNPQEIEEWAKILLATDCLPLPPELAESFRAMVENLDLLALYKNDPGAAAITIRVIAAQLAYPRDEMLLRRFEDDVLQIILCENGQSDGGERNEQANAHRQKIGGVTLEVAVRMIFRDVAKPGELRSTEGLLIKLVEYAAQFRDLIPIHGLIRVIHEMPPDKAWQLWPVLLAARAAV